MSRPRVQRPTLLPALRRLWRDPHRLQLGTDPTRALLLELPDPHLARLLDLLDGTRTEPGLLRDASRDGIPIAEAAHLLRLLRQSGLLVDARTLTLPGSTEESRQRLRPEAAALARAGHAPSVLLRRRRDAHVVITGSSKLAVPIAAVLGAAGIGHISADLPGLVQITEAGPAGVLPADVQRPRGVAAAEAVRRAAPEVTVAHPGPRRATFAVLAGVAAPPSLTALSLGRRRLAHLAVTVRDGVVVIGPLVRPGLTPCLNCLDLHRRDRDPGWPAVSAQLHSEPVAPAEQWEPVLATTALAGVAYAAKEVLNHVDGEPPAALGATIEVTAPGQECRRRWTQHPHCDCVRRSRGRHTHPPLSRC